MSTRLFVYNKAKGERIMVFIEYIKVILIGIIEGITEWLPVSSTGHMLLFDAFIPLDMSEKFKEMFFVVIQFGAILAVVAAFWRRMIPFEVKNKKFELRTDRIMMWVHVLIACIPAAVLGLLFDDFLEAHFGNALTIALMLIIYGVAFILVENYNKKREPKIGSISQVDYKTALFIGCFQALSMIPGTSRSGATIIGALLLGVSRVAAAEFTFYLAVPTMLGASLLKLVKFGIEFTASEAIALLIGMLTAFVVSLFAVKFLMNYVKRHDFKVFGWYRIALGIVILFIIKLI